MYSESMNTHLFFRLATCSVALFLGACTGVGQKNYEGGPFQQSFFGGKVVRQADFPTAEMCAAGLRYATPGPDSVMTCSKTSLRTELPYTGRVVNSGWGLDGAIHFRVREACSRESASVPADVKITCP